MGHNHIGARLYRLFHHSIANIETDENLADILNKGTNEQSRIVPILSQTLGRNALQGVHNHLTFYHFSRSSNALTRRFT